jgi:hypothetical protein
MSKKLGAWTVNEIFYLMNHVDVLTQKLGSLDQAIERTAYLLNRSEMSIKTKYFVEKQKTAHRAG